MARKLLGGFPMGLDLADGFTLRFTAVDPTTGAEDAGVVISNVSLLVDNLGGGDLSNAATPDTIEWIHVGDNLFAPDGGG